jgi:putative ABC transport system permease protein
VDVVPRRRPFFVHVLTRQSQAIMGASYLKTAVRSLWKHRGFTAINVVGLAVSLAVSLLALLFVWQQWRVDRFHSDADRLRRVTTTFEGTRYATSPRPLQNALREQASGVAAVAAVDHDETFLARGETSLSVDVIETDSEFWRVFDGFRLRSGTRGEVLARPRTAVVSVETARQLFGAEDPVGRTFQLRGETEYTVTGVLAPPTGPTHVGVDVYLSTEGDAPPTEPEAWRSMYTTATYVRLADGAPGPALQKTMNTILQQRAAPEDRDRYRLVLQSLTEMQFWAGATSNDFAARFDIPFWFFAMFGGLSVVVLLAAGFNYVNLAVARSLRRAREVGVRKTLGARRAQLIGQFLGEAVVTALAASVVAAGLLTVLVPAFSNLYLFDLMEVPPMDASILLDPTVVAGIVGAGVIVGLLAGAYPAFILSSYRPVQALSSRGTTSTGGSPRLRAALITAQVAFTLILVVTAVTMLRQTRHMAQSDFKLDTERMVAVPLHDVSFDRFRRAARDLADVAAVSATSNLMLGPSNYTSDNLRSRHVDTPVHTIYYSVDTSFVETMDLDLLAQAPNWRVDWADGRAAVLNESAVEALGFASPSAALGQTIQDLENDRVVEHPIVAVVGDFEFRGIGEVYSSGYVGTKGGEVMLVADPSRYDFALVRARSDDLAALRGDLEEMWTRRLETVYPFSARFYDDVLRMRHGPMQNFGVIVAGVAFLAILIAVLGLLSLAAYHVQRRTKEISVRKALGATATNVVVQLARPFAGLVLGATLGAIPVAWGLNAWWLRLLSDPVSVGGGVVGGCALALAGAGVLTVATQALRAARIDPARTLRDE